MLEIKKSAMNPERGFTLVEMAIVLLIVGLLLGGLLMPLSTQMEQKRTSETEKYLEQVKEALLGFAAANGRLPCPASNASAGLESFAAGGNAANGLCSNFYDGFLPAVTLGLTPINTAGLAIDAWNTPIHYAVYSTPAINAITNPFTSTGGMRNAQIANIAAANPLLSVCTSATGITATTCGGAANTLVSTAPIVIYSLGRNAGVAATGIDEAANPNPSSANNDQVFISHTPATSTAANGEFDDVVTWISVNTLFSRMITAGALP